MKIKTKILSAVLSASLALGVFATPAADIQASALTSSATNSLNMYVPDISITDSSFVNYDYGRLNFRSHSIWLYDFCDEMHTGFGNDTSEIAFVEKLIV